MNAKERFLAALSGGRTDRPSAFPSVDLSYAAAVSGLDVGACFRRPELHAEALTRLFDAHPDIDGAYINLCLSPRSSAFGSDGLTTDTGGMSWTTPDNDVGTVKRRDVARLDDARLAGENPLQDGILDTYELIPERVRRAYMIIPGLTGPFTQLVFMLGLQETLLLMCDDPDGLKRALQLRAELALRWAERYARLGCACVWIGEGPASSTVISPAMYETFVLPYAALVADRLRRHGIRTVMHVCGDISRSARAVARAGTDAMDIDHMVDMEAARAAIGRPICLKGNLDPVALLRETPDEIRSRSRALIAAASGPFALGTGCLVARDTPPANVRAMARACADAAQKG